MSVCVYVGVYVCMCASVGKRDQSIGNETHCRERIFVKLELTELYAEPIEKFNDIHLMRAMLFLFNGLLLLHYYTLLHGVHTNVAATLCLHISISLPSHHFHL